MGAVELCVTYGGENVPQTIDFTFQQHDYGM